jgi:hypothetical protein
MLYPPELRALGSMVASAILSAAMDKNQVFVLLLAQVPTILTVLIGILVHRRKLANLSALMTSFESAMSRFEQKLDAL